VQTTKIVFLNNRSLLASGVLNLLEAMAGVCISVVPSDSEDWAGVAGNLEPEVIVLDAGDENLGNNAITQILDRSPGATVVAVSLDRDTISVYQVNRVTKTTLDGLREAIRSPRKKPVDS
jgi:DNA-binding NarL/FixJ family response regulator